MTDLDAPMAPTDDLPTDASPRRVLRDQRKIIMVAAFLIVAPFWILGPVPGEWVLAGCIAGGVFLALLNHLVTEWWLLRLVVSGAKPTRGQMARATMLRLAVLTAVALVLVVWFWPDGVGLLFGLAVFRLIALVMTSLPLLKELKSQ